MQDFKVFIGGTIEDLKCEREIAERAIKDIKLKAIRTETIGYPSNPNLEVCLQLVRECDVYIGIYGATYGTIAPGRSISYTEAEHKEARRCKKPIFIYLKADITLEPRQQAFIAKWKKHFRRSPFHKLADLEEYIKEDIIDLFISKYHANLAQVIDKAKGIEI